jgi:hypothetical protein
MLNYLLSTNPETVSESFNSRDFSVVVYEGVADDVTEVTNEAKEKGLDAAETSVGIGVLVADNVSLVTDVALPAAFMFGPKAIATVGSVGTVADGVSLGLKTVDYLYFDGSPEAVRSQFFKTVFNAGKVEGLKNVRLFQRNTP